MENIGKGGTKIKYWTEFNPKMEIGKKLILEEIYLYTKSYNTDACFLFHLLLQNT